MGGTSGDKERSGEPEGRDGGERGRPEKSKQPPIKVKRTPKLRLRKVRRLGR